MNHTEYSLTWRLATLFAWLRSPVATTKDSLSLLKWKLGRWIWPPTLHELRLERAAMEELQPLMKALEAGDFGVYDGNPVVPSTPLRIEDLSATLNDVVFRSCCLNLVKDGRPVSHVHDIEPAQLPLRQRMARWFRGQLPVRVVVNAWMWYE